MYIPDHFMETRPEVLHQLIATHRLATIARVVNDELVADHIPLLFDANAAPHGVLRGHVARANPIWRDADRSNVLVIFQGPQAYISPSWYASKAVHGKVVPTWNYAVVHAHGILNAIDSHAWVHGHVTQNTDDNEARFAKPWAVGDAPDDFIRKTAAAIVGIEIQITTLVGKWKVSQNRSAADRASVIEGLREDSAVGTAEMATLVPPAD